MSVDQIKRMFWWAAIIVVFVLLLRCFGGVL